VRRFEHANGRFWQVDRQPGRLDIRWGKSGTHGQGRTVVIPDDDVDAKLAELIAKQLAEGYREVTKPDDVVKTIEPERRWFRRFEDGARFRELTLDGRHVQQRTGLLQPDDDDRDETNTAEHPTPEAAREIMAKVIAATIRDGFVLVSESEQPPEALDAPAKPAAENVELELQCRAAPDHAETWAVYADWLMAHDDVRGELAALRARGKELDAARVFGAHQRTLLGTHNGVADAVKLTSWRHGFPIAAAIKLAHRERDDERDLAAVTAAFLALPIATFVDALRFGLMAFSDANDWRPTLDAVIAAKHAQWIRELRFDDYTFSDSEISWTPYGDFTGALARLPRLEELRIRSGAGGTLGTLVLPALKKFVRVSGGLRAHEIDSIANATWPELEHLEVWFGRGGYGAEGDVPRIQRILDGEGLPALRHLGIVNCEFSDSLIPALAASKLLPRLRTLDLSKGIAASAATAALIEHAAAFRHLESIDLAENMLTDANVIRLQKVFANMKLDEQRAEDMDDDADDDDYRYAALGE
jgi:predicted DNA-binding WGR domain protein